MHLKRRGPPGEPSQEYVMLRAWIVWWCAMFGLVPPYYRMYRDAHRYRGYCDIL